MPRYVVLVDAGADWPDVIHVGDDHEEALRIEAAAKKHFPTSVQVVVSLEGVQEWAEEAYA